jgi:hypothetical protein
VNGHYSTLTLLFLNLIFPRRKIYAEPDSPVKGKVQEERRQVSVPHPDFENKDEENPIWSVAWFVPSSYQRDVFLGEQELDSPVYGEDISFLLLVHNDINAEYLYLIPFSSVSSLTLLKYKDEEFLVLTSNRTVESWPVSETII